MDNVRVFIYIDGVFDELMVFSYGKEENRFVIIMKSNGEIDYIWGDKFLGKYVRDGFLSFVNSFVSRICLILMFVVKFVLLVLLFL